MSAPDTFQYIEVTHPSTTVEQSSASGTAEVKNTYDGSGQRSFDEGGIIVTVEITVNGNVVATKDLGEIRPSSSVQVPYGINGLDLRQGSEVEVCVVVETALWATPIGGD